jgi:hypothetical protein
VDEKRFGDRLDRAATGREQLATAGRRLEEFLVHSNADLGKQKEIAGIALRPEGQRRRVATIAKQIISMLRAGIEAK